MVLSAITKWTSLLPGYKHALEIDLVRPLAATVCRSSHSGGRRRARWAGTSCVGAHLLVLALHGTVEHSAACCACAHPPRCTQCLPFCYHSFCAPREVVLLRTWRKDPEDGTYIVLYQVCCNSIRCGLHALASRDATCWMGADQAHKVRCLVWCLCHLEASFFTPNLPLPPSCSERGAPRSAAGAWWRLVCARSCGGAGEWLQCVSRMWPDRVKWLRRQENRGYGEAPQRWHGFPPVRCTCCLTFDALMGFTLPLPASGGFRCAHVCHNTSAQRQLVILLAPLLQAAGFTISPLMSKYVRLAGGEESQESLVSRTFPWAFALTWAIAAQFWLALRRTA